MPKARGETYQPVEYIEDVCGIYFRGICLANALEAVPQHQHDHDHATLVASGAVRVWVENEYLGDFASPKAIEIKAGKAHIFQALEPMTRLYCVHNLDGEPYRVLRETQLEKA